nr:MAG TPA: hypothetical protein [Caudoviricetes sp.]
MLSHRRTQAIESIYEVKPLKGEEYGKERIT